MSYWVPAMSRWGSNTTWLDPKGSKTPKKRVKRARHVALGPRHVALNLQHDVAPPPRRQNSPKGSQKSVPCRVGPPTRRGSTSKAPKLPKKEQKECATSHWAPAMSRWASNTTWLRLQGGKTAQKGAERARHVVLGPRHDALGLQRDVAPQLQTPSY